MNERCAHETRKEARSLISLTFVKMNFSCHNVVEVTSPCMLLFPFICSLSLSLSLKPERALSYRGSA